MDDDSPRGDLFQNYEMVHVPMEDARDLKLRKILRLDPKGARIETEPMTIPDQARKSDPLDRWARETASHGRKVHLVAMEIRNHGETGEAAFRSLCLEEHRKIFPFAQALQLVRKRHNRGLRVSLTSPGPVLEGTH